MSPQANSFYEDLYPRGFRKFLGISVVCLTSLIPALMHWKQGPDPNPQPAPAFGPHYSGHRGLAGPQPDRFSQPRKLVDTLLAIGRTLLAVLGGVLGLAIYYPRSGFKRFALLCGPILGIGSMMLAGWYLTGRTKVYRFEAVFAALIGAFPGIALYVLLVRRKWRKKHATETLWIE